MPKPPPGVFKRESKTGKTRYAVRVYDSRANGNQRWVGTYGSLADAISAKSAAAADQNLSGSCTVSEWAGRWLIECPRSERTMRAYRYATKAAVERFGDRAIRSITKAEANSFMVSSPKNAGDAVRVLFADAERLGLIPFNPFKGHRRSLPPVRRPRLPKRDELDALVAIAGDVHGSGYGAQFAALIEVAAWTAMRPGELFALCMRQVDLDRNTITVDGQLLRSGRRGPPKTRRCSEISLAPRARRALLAIAPADPAALVFRTMTGRPFSQSKLHYYWHPVRVAAGLPSLQFYDLRHFCATQLVEKDVLPCDVAIQLGHCDNGRLVMEHYLNPDEERARRAIGDAFDDLDDAHDNRDDRPATARGPVPRRPSPGTSGATSHV